MKNYLIKFRVWVHGFSKPQVESHTESFVCFQDAYAWAIEHLEWLWGANDSAEILCIRQEKGE